MNTKQTVFVNEYLKCWNSSEAARRAGYNGKANVIGPRLLADVSIKAEIDARIAELIMSADEALILLSEQARGSLGDFGGVQVLADLEGHPKARLVKALTSDVYEDKAGKVHYKARIELHDAQSAILNVLKIHGKFVSPGESDDKPFIVKVVRGVSIDDL
jgi:phage terminase small subunit